MTAKRVVDRREEPRDGKHCRDKDPLRVAHDDVGALASYEKNLVSKEAIGKTRDQVSPNVNTMDGGIE